ncbi:hypothetical protein [Thiolapillus sp.]|uniref:hypothetical protein n=1 Tax=Thiolapillus sp. TaxID=2017437 RepID=UPI0025DD176B|nr:hypothetical protein [Thiolapillus sp.]
MTRTAGAPIGCQRPSRFWGLGCPKIYHEAEDTLVAGGQAGPDRRAAGARAGPGEPAGRFEHAQPPGAGHTEIGYIRPLQADCRG